jgi:hypothetical protein
LYSFASFHKLKGKLALLNVFLMDGLEFCKWK